MFGAGLKHTVRSLLYSWKFTSQCVFGLTMAFVCCLLMYSFVASQFAFDRFHENSNRIYRLIGMQYNEEGTLARRDAVVYPALAGAIEQDIPEVEDTVRITGIDRMPVTYDGATYYTEHFLFSDSSIFDVFNFNLVDSEGGELLDQPDTAVVTETFASRLFGEADPLGKIIRLDATRDLRIVGVLENNRGDSHLQFDLIVSLRSNRNDGVGFTADMLESWQNIFMITYVLLYEGSDSEIVQERVNQIVSDRAQAQNFQVEFQPLSETHLYSTDIGFERNFAKGDIKIVVFLITAILVILLVSLFNFINLTTAKTPGRYREIAMRQVLGERNLSIGGQIFFECFIIVLVSLVLSLLLAEVLYPWFQYASSGGVLGLLDSRTAAVLGFVISAAALLAAIYPSYMLMVISISDKLRGQFDSSLKGIAVRKTLVTSQVALSASIIICSIVVSSQISFMRMKEKGFEAENIIIAETDGRDALSNATTFKQLVSNLPYVTSVTSSGARLGDEIGRLSVTLPGTGRTEPVALYRFTVDSNYLDTFGIELLEGRDFSDETGFDRGRSTIINESAKALFGWDDPVGRNIRLADDSERTIIGVIRDFEFRGPKFAAGPLMLTNYNGGFYVTSIKVNAESIDEALAQIREAWEEVNPNHAFFYSVLQENLDLQLQDEDRLLVALLQFNIVAIILSGLGLVALVSYTVAQRRKEIGIRKVLGASVGDVVLLVVKDYLPWILGANFIAWIFAYYVSGNWLSNFPSQVSIDYIIVLLVSAVITASALATIALSSYTAASANPISVIKSD